MILPVTNSPGLLNLSLFVRPFDSDDSSTNPTAYLHSDASNVIRTRGKHNINRTNMTAFYFSVITTLLVYSIVFLNLEWPKVRL